MKSLILIVCSLLTSVAYAQAVDINYAENVAPIFVEQCQSCHREGGIAPWAMTDYRMLQAFAPSMTASIHWRKN